METKKLLSIVNAIAIGLFSIAMLLICLVLIVKVNPCFGMLQGGILTIIACILSDHDHDSWGIPCGLIGFATCFFSLPVGLSFWQVNVVHEDDSKVVIYRGYNSVFGKKIDEGLRVYVLQLSEHYRRNYCKYDVHSSKFYLLQKEDSTFVLYNSWFEVCRCSGVPEFKSRDFGHGKLHVINFKDKETGETKCLDLHGNVVNSIGYEPPVVDITPEIDCTNL